MSPITRRDFMKQTVAATALATMGVAGVSPSTHAQSGLLAMDSRNAVAGVLGTVIYYELARWDEDDRARFLSVIEREFPDIAVSTVDKVQEMDW